MAPLMMETLPRILNRAKEEGSIDGILVKGRDDVGVEVSHLLFADDTLIFVMLVRRKLEHLSWSSCGLKAISRLKINLKKSELIQLGMSQIWRSLF
ncbi:hypothetical protein CK203_063184 [Vitis vinifera]|uniref:Reverse transcriptase domain-containing protein n=1 Tax=Vitis vinifera TaxID=29760 RepID=A0A438G4H0_VITVI|nr:hypothetical protein CK203_063184 [Vitis vinifera]